VNILGLSFGTTGTKDQHCSMAGCKFWSQMVLCCSLKEFLFKAIEKETWWKSRRKTRIM